MDVRVARKSKGLTQEQLAHLAGVDQGALSRIENGSQPVSERAADKLASVLDVSPFAIKLGNRARAAQRALDNGDPVAVLKATKAIVKDLPDDPKLDSMIDWLVDTAVKFAEDCRSAVVEGYDQDPEECRSSSACALPDH